MSIIFACSCGKRMQADEVFAGKKARCPKCGKIMPIPMPGVAASVAAPPPRLTSAAGAARPAPAKADPHDPAALQAPPEESGAYELALDELTQVRGATPTAAKAAAPRTPGAAGPKAALHAAKPAAAGDDDLVELEELPPTAASPPGRGVAAAAAAGSAGKQRVMLGLAAVAAVLVAAVAIHLVWWGALGASVETTPAAPGPQSATRPSATAADADAPPRGPAGPMRPPGAEALAHRDDGGNAGMRRPPGAPGMAVPGAPAAPAPAREPLIQEPVTEYLGALGKARQKGLSTAGASNMNQIGQIIIHYTLLNDDRFPDTLDDLRDLAPTLDQVLVNPRTKASPGFVYIKPGDSYNSIPNPANVPMLWEIGPDGKPDPDGLVVYADGHVGTAPGR